MSSSSTSVSTPADHALVLPMLAQEQTRDSFFGWSESSSRPVLAVMGPDRVKWLQGLTTNDLTKLSPGDLAQTFCCTDRGRVLQYTLVTALDDRLLLDIEPGQMDVIVPHLTKYHLFDDIQLVDQTADGARFSFWGQPASNWLADKLQQSMPGPNQAVVFQVEGVDIIARHDARWLVPRFDLMLPAARREVFSSQLNTWCDGPNPPQMLSGPQVESLRIGSAIPSTPIDLADQPLPQELGLDDQTISFTKGCYLGQETVARLDSRGHVNRLWRRLRFESPHSTPQVGSVLMAGAKKVGVLTSVTAESERDYLGLAFVRVNEAPVGQLVDVVPADQDNDSNPSALKAVVLTARETVQS